MLRRFAFLAAVLAVPAAARGQLVTWQIDPGHRWIKERAKMAAITVHMGLASNQSVWR